MTSLRRCAIVASCVLGALSAGLCAPGSDAATTISNVGVSSQRLDTLFHAKPLAAHFCSPNLRDDRGGTHADCPEAVETTRMLGRVESAAWDLGCGRYLYAYQLHVATSETYFCRWLVGWEGLGG